jgi:hypothetical protein
MRGVGAERAMVARVQCGGERSIRWLLGCAGVVVGGGAGGGIRVWTLTLLS